MEIQIQKNQLLTGLSIVVGAVSPRSTLPILANLLLETKGDETLQLSGTDLEVSIGTQVTCRTLKEGAITIPARKLFEVVRELPEGEVSITVAKNFAVNIKTEKTYCRIMGLGREDFPKLPEIKNEDKVILEQAVVKHCLGLTSFAVSHDESRYVLNGVLIEIKKNRITFVATDGRRLACVQKTLENAAAPEFQIILPAKAVGELVKNLTVGELEVARAQNQICFKMGKTILISRLIEGHFPNYEQVVPKEEKTTAQINKQGFLAGVKRAALFTTQEAQAVKFDFVKGKVLVSAHSANLGEVKEEVDAEVVGDEISIGFNPNYLLDALKNVEGEGVTLSLTKPDKPGLLKSGDDYLYVVMPMQIT